MHSEKRHKKPVDENVNKQKKSAVRVRSFYTAEQRARERERESASQATAADSKCLIHFGINENEKKKLFTEREK